MKKKNLAIILILPFLISLLGVFTVNVALKSFHHDITAIEWEYEDVEVFKLEAGAKYPLTATPVNTSNYPLAEGNELVWSINDDSIAELYEEDGIYYLIPKAEGELIITCANQKGNVSRRMTGIVYDKGVIVAITKLQSSQNNIDDTIYYGTHDFKDGQKVQASVEFTIRCIPAAMQAGLTVSQITDNITFDIASSTMKIKSGGEASFTLQSFAENTPITARYSFTAVENGVNVYTYDDLLNCTNRSQNGEIVVLRKSFESLTSAYVCDALGNPVLNGGAPQKKQNNVELFGNYNAATKRWSFDREIYSFTTTYNKNYIDQWNEFAKTNPKYKPISDQVRVGLKIQKDFYGNGYTLNLHNLTYPYDKYLVNNQEIPRLRDDNLFRGPLPFYALGDPYNLPLITAYGQDNIGVYIQGDNVLFNDVNLRNCNFGFSITELDTVGTVLEIAGDNVTVKNSVIQNGKTVMRCFSAQNAAIENCLLANSRNFLLSLGCNEYIPLSETSEYDLLDKDGSPYHGTLSSYLSLPQGERLSAGDNLLNEYLLGGNDPQITKTAVKTLQAAMDINAAQAASAYKGSMVVKDVLFYRSGITSIALESYFNGPFLYAGSPSLISMLFGENSTESKPLAPLIPQNVSGASYPFALTLSGKTKFYDYKTADEMDLSGLIDENISSVASEILGENKSVTIDDIFPLKPLLYSQAANTNAACVDNGKTYLNVPIAFYGGGANYSTVTFDDMQTTLDTAISPDWISHYLATGSSSDGKVELTNLSFVKSLVQRTVTVVTGFNDFEFRLVSSGALYGETPDVSQLRNH